MDVAAWLQGLGLERYVPAFRDNEIDWAVLPKPAPRRERGELGQRSVRAARTLLGCPVPRRGGAPAPTAREHGRGRRVCRDFGRIRLPQLHQRETPSAAMK